MRCHIKVLRALDVSLYILKILYDTETPMDYFEHHK